MHYFKCTILQGLTSILHKILSRKLETKKQMLLKRSARKSILREMWWCRAQVNPQHLIKHPPHQPSRIYSYLNIRIKRKERRLNYTSGAFYCKTMKMLSFPHPPKRSFEGPVSPLWDVIRTFPNSSCKGTKEPGSQAHVSNPCEYRWKNEMGSALLSWVWRTSPRPWQLCGQTRRTPQRHSTSWLQMLDLSYCT